MNGQTICMQCGGDPVSIAPCSVLLRRQTEKKFTQAVQVDMANATAVSIAGLMGYYDERSFFLFGIRKENGRYQLEVTEQIGDVRREKTLGILSSPIVALAVAGDGFDRRLMVNGRAILSIRADYLCDEGVQGGKRFTGALVGIAAVGKGRALFTNYQDEMQPWDSFQRYKNSPCSESLLTSCCMHRLKISVNLHSGAQAICPNAVPGGLFHASCFSVKPVFAGGMRPLLLIASK